MMGVENATMNSTRHTVDLYRTPELKNADFTASDSGQLPTALRTESITDSHITSTAGLINETNPNFPTSEKETISLGTTRQLSTPTTRRERRPDREVYVPRARRSQTTPPTATTKLLKPLAAKTMPSTASHTAVGCESFSADDSITSATSTLKDKSSKTTRNQKDRKKLSKRTEKFRNPAQVDNARCDPSTKTKPTANSSSECDSAQPTQNSVSNSNYHSQNQIKHANNDDQESQRSSTETNRSNRRITKQTSVPDSVEQRIHDNCMAGKNSQQSRQSTTEEDDEGDWEQLYDDSGECLDPKIVEELAASLGKVKIEKPKMDYNAFLAKETKLNEEDFPHVLEVSNFPVEFQDHDLLQIFSQYKGSGFSIKWVDDTHALAVFSCSKIAAEVLTNGHSLVKLKPLSEATPESRQKAKRCATALQPYKARPATCAALARRLVSGALGVRLPTSAADRDNEKRVLREAKERKIQAAKQREEIWES